MNRALRLLALGAGAVGLGSGFGAGSYAERGHAARSGLLPPIARVVTRDRVIALTFDDGPDPRWTPAVLRLLARYHARATFFLIGARATAFRGLVRDELAAGDELGNHTWSHPDLRQLPPARIEWELQSGARAIERAGAPPPRLFRPPMGWTNEIVDALAEAQGSRTILWTVAVEHFVDHESRPLAVRRLLQLIRPGTIVLAHDGGSVNRSRTIAALPALLEGLAERGYRFTTVSNLLELGRASSKRS